MKGTHTEAEDHGWTINIGDHPKRADTPLYGRSRKHMITALGLAGPDFYFGGGLMTAAGSPNDAPAGATP